MSSLDSAGCVSEVTLAISKTKTSQASSIRILDSPDSDGSSRSNSLTVQRYNYSQSASPNGNLENSPDENLRIPIVGYEVMEERARFTVYKLRVELKNGDCWFVFRRYTDFVRLQAQLKKQKLVTSHLSLPRKKWLGDNFAPSFLEGRINGLQAFVNQILATSQLLSANCVREFFCLDEPPAISDAVEESRAIFEALEDTIYHLRQQLRERDEMLATETKLCDELRTKLQGLFKQNQCSVCGATQS